MESVKWLKDKASNLIEAGGFEEAMPYLDRLLKLPGIKPYDIYFAHFSLGQIHFQAGRWVRSQNHLQQAIEMDGEDPFIMLLLGQVYCAQGKHHKGRDILEEAYSLKPKDTSIQISLGTCMCLQKEFEEAEEVFRRVIKLGTDNYEPHVGLAQSLIGQHRWEEAKEALETAKVRFPLVLVIRQMLKDLEKIDEIEDFYNWFMDEAFDESLESEWLSIPLDLAKTALAELKFPPEAIDGAENLWDDFLEIGGGTHRVPEVWAAGIVYTISRLYDRTEISQAKLARRFDVSAAGVSRVFRTISNDLKIAQNDPRYLGKRKK